MTRAALVACLLAAAASVTSSAALGAPAGSTYVVRGIVVQYIPPAGSVVGSLSIRVVKVNARGRALLGELVTVAVQRGDAPKKPQQLRPSSVFTLTLNAPSPASILKGAADVRSIAPAAPPAAAAGATPAHVPANPDASGQSDSDSGSTGGNPAGGSSDDHGSSQSNDHGSAQGSDHGKGQGNSASQGRSGGGNANGHNK
jgi:hypothetical protein